MPLGEDGCMGVSGWFAWDERMYAVCVAAARNGGDGVRRVLVHKTVHT
jgi:hypothetical protein